MAQQPEHGREPCPDRILDDIGGAFGMGAIGGGAWHTWRGLRNSPKGYKLVGTLEAVRREAPRIGGNFANWGLMFSVFDCTCQAIRKKEDPFNAIIAGAATGGFLQIRAGLRPAFRSAVFGGVLLAIIEGLGITLSKMTAPPPPSMPFPQPGMPGGPPPGPEAMGGGMGMPPPPPPGSMPDAGLGASTSGLGGEDGGAAGGGGGSWFSWFTGSEQKPDTSSQATVLHEDSFQPPPMPSFQGDGFKH